MKKHFIFILSFFSLLSFSQMTMTKLDGTPINNGDVFEYNVIEGNGTYLKFKIFNSSDTDINVKAKCLSMINSDGTNLQFCIDPVCVNNLIVGLAYPSPDFATIIPANGENGNFDHFFNHNPGTNPNLNVEYTFKFYLVDDAGVEIPTANSVTLTYKYIPTLSNANFAQQSAGVIVKSTLVENFIELDVQKNTTMSMYDVSGKLIQNSELNRGNQLINISHLSSGSYIVSFENNDGQSATVRFIKK